MELRPEEGEAVTPHRLNLLGQGETQTYHPYLYPSFTVWVKSSRIVLQALPNQDVATNTLSLDLRS